MCPTDIPLNGPMVLNDTEWCYKLPLRVPLSPTEIPLNDTMIRNGIQWYTIEYVLRGSAFCLPQREN